MQRANRIEDRGFRETPSFARGPRKLRRKHVEEHFGVARRVEVPPVRLIKLAAQIVGIRQIAVVRKRNAERRIHVEGLALVGRRCVALRRITHVADADAARQIAHVARAKDVAHEAEPLEEVKLKAVERCNAGGVLPAVLKQMKRVVDALIDRRIGHQANDPAHDVFFLFFPSAPTRDRRRPALIEESREICCL